MIRCNLSRSNTFGRLLTSCRAYHASELRNGDSTTTSTNTSIEPPKDEAINNDALDKQTATAAKPQPFKKRDLPISPLMDEAWLAAREKYRTPKLAPSKEPSPLQRKLLRNPYAQALATPVRACAITTLRLPSYFLQDFEIIEHPQTNEKFYLPRSLTSKFRPPEDLASESADTDTESSFIPETDEPPDPSTAAGAIDASNLPEHSRGVGAKAYVLSQQGLLVLLTQKNSRFFGAWMKSFPSRRMKITSEFKQRDLLWREDMPDFVLELMRRRTVEDLAYVATRGRGYLVRCNGFDDVERKKGIGAVLWLPKEENCGTGKGPGEFATLDVEQKKFAVHNLEVLLGTEKCAEIRKNMKIFGDEVVVVKSKNTTNRLLLRLWKLQGYLAKYKGFTYGLPYHGEISKDFDDFPDKDIEDEW